MTKIERFSLQRTVDDDQWFDLVLVRAHISFISIFNLFLISVNRRRKSLATASVGWWTGFLLRTEGSSQMGQAFQPSSWRNSWANQISGSHGYTVSSISSYRLVTFHILIIISFNTVLESNTRILHLPHLHIITVSLLPWNQFSW